MGTSFFGFNLGDVEGIILLILFSMFGAGLLLPLVLFFSISAAPQTPIAPTPTPKVQEYQAPANQPFAASDLYHLTREKA